MNKVRLCQEVAASFIIQPMCYQSAEIKIFRDMFEIFIQISLGTYKTQTRFKNTYSHKIRKNNIQPMHDTSFINALQKQL